MKLSVAGCSVAPAAWRYSRRSAKLCYEQPQAARAGRGTHWKDDRNNHLSGDLCLHALGLFDDIPCSVTLTLISTSRASTTPAAWRYSPQSAKLMLAGWFKAVVSLLWVDNLSAAVSSKKNNGHGVHNRGANDGKNEKPDCFLSIHAADVVN